MKRQRAGLPPSKVTRLDDDGTTLTVHTDGVMSITLTGTDRERALAAVGRQADMIWAEKVAEEGGYQLTAEGLFIESL